MLDVMESRLNPFSLQKILGRKKQEQNPREKTHKRMALTLQTFKSDLHKK